MAVQLTLDHCVGKDNYEDSPKTNWYGFNTVPISEDTRCEYCYRHMKEIDPYMSMFPIGQSPSQIDCDTILHPVLSMLEVNNFRFQVVSQDMKRPFLVYPQRGDERRNGLLCVELPKQSNFAVIIDPQVSSQRGIHVLYYSFKMRVGEKEVVVNDGKTTYYQDRTTIHGYSPTESFEFKAEGKTPNEYETSPENLIRIEVTIYKRCGTTFVKLVEMPIRIQLGYIDPARYQVPVMDETYKKIVDEADNYYYHQSQARMREQFRQQLPNASVSGPVIPPPTLPTSSS